MTFPWCARHNLYFIMAVNINIKGILIKLVRYPYSLNNLCMLSNLCTLQNIYSNNKYTENTF